MYLTRIEMNGFKSFNTKKEILVKKGITGVVGPNGSGKSNIADAIRWVLGEQSSKNLRGTRMEDVIFNGSQEFSKKGFCEVALVFDNTDMRVKSEYSEICVRRKMYRSGESEYSINGTSCRLKDILEMFRDTGIGREGYSIIGQGRIDEILNSKPASRRKVFEEAAGIMKYRVKKDEAERNLERTRENLVRIEDIISELNIQIEPLKQQMDEAKAYMSLRERLKFLEINLYLYNHDKLLERTQKLLAQQQENAEEIAENEEELEKSTQLVSELKNSIADLQQQLDQSNQNIAKFGSEQQRLRGEYNLILEREHNMTLQRDELAAKSVELQHTLSEYAAELDALDGQLAELNGVLDTHSQKLDAMKADEARESGLWNGQEAQLSDLRAQQESLRQEMENARRIHAENALRVRMLEENLDNAGQKEEELQQNVQSASQELLQLQQEAADCTSKKDKTMQQANDLAAERLTLREQYAQKTTHLSELKSKLAQDKSSLALLSGLKEDYEGYASGIRGLFSETDNRNAQIKKRLIGTVADVISVPKEYELAIETLLGNALQNVVVRDESDAKAAIEFLRRERLGRVTFLPLSELRVKTVTSQERDAFDSTVLGVASELISCSPEVRPAVDFLLARTIVVDDLDHAFQIMRKTGYSLRAVTLKGDIVRPGGSVTGGSADRHQTGFLKRNRMQSELQKQLITQQQIIDEEQSACGKLKQQLEATELAHKECIDLLRRIDIDCATFLQQTKDAQRKHDELSLACRQALQNREQTRKECAILKNQIAQAEEQIADKQREYDRLCEQQLEAEAYLAEHAQEAAELVAEIQREELQHKEYVNQKDVLLLKTEHVRAAQQSAQSELQSALDVCAQIERELEQNIGRTRKQLLEQLDDMTFSLRAASESVQEHFRQKEEFAEQCKLAEESVSENSKRQNDLIEQKYRLSAALEKIQLQRETSEKKIWEDYSLTYANAQEYKGDFSYQNGTREMEEIRMSLQEMGTVNPNAIEDYARVNDRLNSLLVQKEDLLKADGDLRKVISSLLSDMRGCFGEKFNQINQKFQEIFKTLFGGGHAELVLQDDGDIMECGIEIIAEPPGKKLQNLTLLSGGEKALCAIALLFAMLDINPSPVCLLDEIDAPLDEANLVRFSDYLKVLSRDLQFIVITHRKPTMAVCDTLYGVAMQKKGVSEILSVDLH